MKLPIRTIIAGASQDLFGSNVPSIVPVDKLVFSPRFLGLIYHYHRKSKSRAYRYFIESELKLPGSVDGPALTAVAHLTKGERREAIKALSRLERIQVPIWEQRHKASWGANIVAIKEWIDGKRFPSDISLQALRDRCITGSMYDLQLEKSNILITPMYHQIRKAFGTPEQFFTAIQLPRINPS